MIENNAYAHEDTLVIIPVFNEEKQIENTINSIMKSFSNILIINDGSTDNTLSIVSRYPVKIISHCINLGQGAALDSGFKYLCNSEKYKFVITFDGDGQHNAKDVLDMLLLAKKKKLDILLASRFKDKEFSKHIPFIKKNILRLAKIYERIFYGIKLTDAHNGLRVISKDVVSKFLLPIEDFDMAHATEISYKLVNSGKKIVEYPAFTNYMKLKSQNSLNAINIAIKSIFKIR